jgi:RHS repeat-associated protein
VDETSYRFMANDGRSSGRAGSLAIAFFTAAWASVSPAASHGGSVSAFGTYRTTIPVEVPAFHSIAPRLALTYDSSSGNGPLGMGWRLDGESRITRVSAGGGAPRYNARDQFWIDGLELIPCVPGSPSLSCRAGGTHAGRVEDYRRYRQDTQPPQNTWTVWQRNGTRLVYRPQLGDVSQPVRTLRWVLREVVDTHDNRVTYGYNCGSQECWLDAIEYGQGATCTEAPDRPVGTLLPGVRIEFRWEARRDWPSLAQGGFLETMDRRLRAIDVTEGGQRVRTYQVTYQPEPAGPGFRLNRSWLTSIQVFGRDAVLQPDGTVSSGSAMPAQTFFSPAQAGPPASPFANTASTSEFFPAYPAAQTLPSVYGNRSVDALPVSHVLRYTATGDWMPPVVTGRTGAAVGDLDGDGRLDFLQWSLDQDCNQLQTRAVLARAPAGRVDDQQPWMGARGCRAGAPQPAVLKGGTLGLTADLDGDRRTDLAFLHYRKVAPFDPADPLYQADLVTALSNGDGTFTAGAAAMLWLGPDWDELMKSRCTVGDANGDGRADVVCTARPAAGWTVVQALSIGAGKVVLAKAPSPNDLTAEHLLSLADANADGLSDVLLLNTRPGAARALDLHVGVSLGDGTSTWRRQPTGLAAPDLTDKARLLPADFNGDGRADLLLAVGAANAASGSFTTFMSSGGASRTYQVARSPFTGEMPAVSVGDRSGDGLDDVILAFRHPPHGANLCGFAATGSHASIGVWPSRDGVLSLPPSANNCYEESTFWASSDWTDEENVFAAQVNGDHWADLFQFVAIGAAAIGGAPLAYVFHDESTPLVFDDFTTRWRQAHLNGDGRIDWVFAEFANPGLVVTSLLTRADGTRTRVVRTIPSTQGDLASTGAVADWLLADVGGAGNEPDGRADIVVIDDLRKRTVTLLGAGDGTWTPVLAGYDPLGRIPNSLRHGHLLTALGDAFNWRPMDVNGDGLVDLVHTALRQPAPGPGSLSVATLLARGDGTWRDPVVTDHYAGVYSEADVHNFMPADVDGDGRMDLVLLETYGGQTVTGNKNTSILTLLADGSGRWREVPPQSLRQPYMAARGWRPMEVNGDGRTDLAYVASPPGGSLTVSYFLSLGDGTWDDVKNTPVIPAPAGVDSEAVQEFGITDLDHDGQDDLLLVANVPAVPILLTATLTVWNRFPHFGATTGASLPFPSTHTRAWRATDTTADDQPELVRLQFANAVLMEVIHLPVPQSRITRAANGMGGSEEVSYRTSAGDHRLMPTGALARVVHTIDARAQDGAPPAASTTYAYGGATYLYGPRRHFAGFERIEASEPHRAMDADYDLDASCGPRVRRTALTDAAAQRLLRRTSYKFEPVRPQAGGPAYCAHSSVQNEEWEGAATPRISTTTLTHDGFGNLSSLIEGGDLNNPQDDRRLETEVNPLIDPDHFIVDRPMFRRLKMSVRPPLSPLVAETRYEYDNSGDYRRPPGPHGDLTREIRLDVPTGREAATAYEFDARGNRTKVTGPPIPSNPAGVAMTITYDCEFARFAERICDPVFCSESIWDKTLGRVAESRDANSVPTVFTFDALGRPDLLTRADGSFERWRWPVGSDWNTPQQVVKHEVSDGSITDGVHWTTQRLDGLSRVTETRREGDVQHEILEYDGTSPRVKVETAPHRVAEAPQRTRYGYDPAGRLVQVTHPDGSGRLTTFSLGRHTVRDELGATVTYDTDPFGRITAVHENRRDCQAEICPVVETAVTRYRYDALDRLVRIEDAARNVTTVEWSLFGPLRACDPDRGCVASTWNLDGTLASASDAAGSRTLGYDALGRILTREVKDAAGARVRLVRWTWDNDPTTGTTRGASLGQVTAMRDDSVQAKSRSAFSYDLLGRVDLSERCLDGACAQVRRVFDPAGRVERLTLGGSIQGPPVTLSVDYRYSQAGRLASVPGYIRRTDHDAAGRLTAVELENGVEETRQYNPARGWSEQVSITGPTPGGATTLFEQVRGYDLAGRARHEQISGLLGTRTETFTHDDLRRLRAVVSSDPARARTFDFDLLGNLTSHSRLGTVLRNDAAHVHAATDTSSGEHYDYDALGRMQRSNTVEVAWGAEPRPLRLTDRRTQQAVDLTQDWTGRLVRRTTSSGAVSFPDELVEIDHGGGIAFWIVAEGRRVARASGQAITFLHTDALGSIRLLTDQAGAVSGQQDYDTWGEHTFGLGAGGSPYSYVGGLSALPTALVQLGARAYDPAAGQFLSADEVVPNVYAPQSLNRYRYALNDPVTLVDPSGHVPQGFIIGEGDAPGDWTRWPESSPKEWEPYPTQLTAPPLSPPPLVNAPSSSTTLPVCVEADQSPPQPWLYPGQSDAPKIVKLFPEPDPTPPEWLLGVIEEVMPPLSEELTERHLPEKEADLEVLKAHYRSTYKLLEHEDTRISRALAMNVSPELRRALAVWITNLAAANALKRTHPTPLEEFNAATAPPGAFTTPTLPLLNPAILDWAAAGIKNFWDKSTGRFSGTLDY